MKENEPKEHIVDQSVTLEYKEELNQAPYLMQTTVIEMKEKEVVPSITLLPYLSSSILPTILEVDAKGNEKRNDEEENSIVSPLELSEEQQGAE